MRAHNITDRDYELLSAYIDGQLAPSEKERLEERLNTRPELVSALDEMQRTRTLLRQAPRRRAPRNFTVTPAMVGNVNTQRRSAGGWLANLFPAMGFASALAVLLLVATIAFQLGASQQQTQTIAMSAPAAKQTTEQMRTAEDATGQAVPTSPALALPAAPAPTQAEPAQQKAAPEPTQSAEATAAEPALAAPADMVTETAVVEATQEEPAAGAALNPGPTPTREEDPAYSEGPPPLMDPGAEISATPTPPNEEQPAPEQPAGEQAPAAENPIVIWNNADGRGGGGGGDATGMGGGGGQGPTMGGLMGPPEPPASANSGVLQNGPYAGKEGAPYGNLVLPPEAANSVESNNVTPQVPAQPNESITGSGPILGAAGQGEGGQIIDRKAILGNNQGLNNAQPQARDMSQPQSAMPQVANANPQEPEQSGSPTARYPWLPAAQIALAVIAVLTGAAAFILRRRARS